MSVIIRLQNLPWSANSLDIRHYFRGLSIPEGGVHIVGGELGDAFIAFSTDEDARQAMMLTGGKIKEVQISLMLSSRSEMQNVIEAARTASASDSLPQLFVPPALSLTTMQQQLPVKDPRVEKIDFIDLSTSSHETGSKRNGRDRSRSRSRGREKKDWWDRDRDRDRNRDRDRRRKSRSRSRSRDCWRRRSRSRSRGYTIDREQKDGKEDVRKKAASSSVPIDSPKPSLLNPKTWIQQGPLAQNVQFSSNFELFRNLANQKGPLFSNLSPLLLSSPSQDKTDTKSAFRNRQGSADMSFEETKGKSRPFSNGNLQENIFRGDRFDGGRNEFYPGFPMSNGNEPLSGNRFGNVGRVDKGFFPRGPSPNRERPNSSRGLLDFSPQGDDRNRQEKFSHWNDDRVDEFGRSIQLRNRKNAAQEEALKETNFQGNQQNFSGFRFGNQQNQPQQQPPLMRGREWPSGGGRNNDNFKDKRGDLGIWWEFRGDLDEQNRMGIRQKGRDSCGKFQDENDQSSETDCCVEIRNLAPHIAYGEVRRSFSNQKLIIREIKFFDYHQNEKKCRIRFLNYENKRKALQISGKIVIDSKQVFLLHITDSQFEECVDEGVRRPDVRVSDDEDDLTILPKDAYVQVKNLTLNVQKSDIVSLFPDAGIEKIVLENDGNSKSAFIKFKNPVDAKLALSTPKRSLGDCTTFLTPIPQHVFNDHLNRTGKLGEGKQWSENMEVDISKSSGAKSDNLSTCILMENLPSHASDRDVCDFFSDVGLVPRKIHLMMNVNGQPSGKAFCEFLTASQVKSACGKNFVYLGKNIISVSEVPRSQMLKALGVVQGEMAPGAHNFGRPQCVLQLENIPFRAGSGEIINFFGWSYKLTENDILRRYNERGQPTGDAKVCFKSPEDALRALRFFNNRTLNGRTIRMKPLYVCQPQGVQTLGNSYPKNNLYV